MLKNLQNKISFSYMILLTLKMNLKRGMNQKLIMNSAINLITNGDKLSVQFPKLGKKVLKENQSDSSNLALLDHQLLKNNRTLGIEKKFVLSSYHPRLVYQHPEFILKKNFISIIFNGKTYKNFRVESL